MNTKVQKALKIMLIDDNELDLMLNKKILGRHSSFCAAVLPYLSAREALKFLNNAQPDLLPDCILLDLRMYGMSGFEFLNEYGKLPESFRNSCSLFILTASDYPGMTQRAEANVHVAGLLSKPLKVDILKRKLKQASGENTVD
ncbi:MAG: response regulator [Niabella sp.]